MVPDRNDLVDAINEIFRIDGAPYQLTPLVTREEKREGLYGGGTYIHVVAWPQVVRAEDETTHAEAVAPALSVLSAPHFEAANLEFRNALDEYRKGDYGDCLIKCCSAFESVMKVLCTNKAWAFDPAATAGPLLKIVLSHTQLPTIFEAPLIFTATLRNRISAAHGGGTKPRAVVRHIAQYAVTMTAAAIVILVHEVGT